MFQGSDDMVNWVDIEHRSTANHQWNTNEERIFWVGVPTGIPGIPQDDFDQYNVREPTRSRLAVWVAHSSLTGQRCRC